MKENTFYKDSYGGCIEGVKPGGYALRKDRDPAKAGYSHKISTYHLTHQLDRLRLFHHDRGVSGALRLFG